ncbi:MAG: hypothetical protein PHU56_03290 [Candidatus Pacebacteria bacterium]|nr:hypothetical protein [Candidatus Paceibacterota bacterium]
MPERIKTKKSPRYVTVFFILALILFFPVVLLVALMFLIPWLNVRFIQRHHLLRGVRSEWLPQNRFILFVYSDKQLWKEYAEKNIIPKIESRAAILNWSQRREWIDSDSLEVRLFKNFQWGREWIWAKNIRMGGQEYNHIAIVFKPWNKPKTINFWKAFKDYEFGKKEGLETAKNELLSYL